MTIKTVCSRLDSLVQVLVSIQKTRYHVYARYIYALTGSRYILIIAYI